MSSKSPEKNSPLAIIGVGCLFPKAHGPAEYWRNIKNRVDGITDIPASHWSAEDYYDKDPKRADFTYARRGGFISPVEFDPAEFGISPNTLEATDSAQLLGLVAAGQALKDAGYGPERDFDRSRVSVILGVTGTLELVVPLGARLGHPIWRKALLEAGIDGAKTEEVVEKIKESYVGWQENSFPGLLGNVVAGRIANRFNLGGTNCVVDAACASSLSAAHLAGLELSTGRSSMVVTGGVDCFNDIFMFMCFSKTPALSPSGDSRPFDSKADGTALGEGIGMVVLKRLEDAEKDGDKIYALLKGIGSSSDGRGKAIYAPSAEGQTKALEQAYRLAGVTPDTVELVEAHGTGTVAGDAAELGALSAVYREAQKEGTWCALGSVKSQIGHTKAAAGSAGLIKAALSLYHKVLPPTIKASEPVGALSSGESPFYLNTEKRPWLSRKRAPRRAAVSALGFGGSNFHAVLEEYHPQKTEVDWDGDAQIVALSAASVEGLESALAAWDQALSWDEIRVQAMQARAAFASDAEYRICFALEREKLDLKKIVSAARAGLAELAAKPSWSHPDGIFAGRGRPGKLAVLFPGQGSQYVGMGRDLSCQFPKAYEALAQADEAFAQEKPLSDYIYARPAFNEKDKASQEAALRATQVAQSALGAVSLGAWRVLEDFGVKADAFAGHSYGELVALCAAERLAPADLFALSKLRGELMAQGDGGRGGMLAVQAPLADIERTIREEKIDLVVANKNAPQQSVLSGRKEEIARAAEIFTSRGIKNVALPVAAAFHSALVESAQKPLRQALDCLGPKKDAEVYANKTGQAYPSEARAAADLLAAQLACPVEFVAMIENMGRAGVSTFLEVGAGARITGLAGAILGKEDAVSLALDSSGGRRHGAVDLGRALAQLAALGHRVDLKPWQGGEAAVAALIGRKKPKMAVMLDGANYRSPRTSSPKPKVSAAPAPRAIAQPAALPISAPSGLLDALKANQQSMDALQKLQEQTAALHAQFLANQEMVQQSFQGLMAQQQALFAGTPMPVMPQAPVRTVLPAAAPVAAPVAAVERAPSNDVEKVLLAVVSEKTGYPPEMLNADMDMESDLGIDSIKRVEILSALHEKLPDAPAVKPEHLGTLRTLRQIASFLSKGQAAPKAPLNDNVEKVLLAVVSEKTGYPPEMLNADMDMESDLGIDSIKRVEILSALHEKLPGAPAVKPEHLGTLRTLRQIAAFLSSGGRPQPAAPAAEPAAAVESSGISRRVLKLSPLGPAQPRDAAFAAPILVAAGASPLADAICAEFERRGISAGRIPLSAPKPDDWGGLVIVAPEARAGQDGLWEAESEAAVKAAFILAQAAEPALRRNRGVFATVSRLDGAFGLRDLKGADPIFGALAGLAKTAAREWPEVSCKAIDAAAGWSDAKAVVDEILAGGPVEAGLSAQGRMTLELSDRDVPAGTAAPLKAGDLVAVTGGARGVTAEVCVALARAFQPEFLILGRTAPAAEAAWLKECRTEADIKRELLKNSGDRALSPKRLSELYQGVAAGREIARNIARIEEAGSKVVYAACDIRDEASVKIALARPVRGIIHGAGVLADKLIAEKTSEQLDAVFDTKVRGLRHLLKAAGPELKTLVLFSSSTARYGRVGQSDYAMANEALNKIAQQQALLRPSCRVLSVNWGPWDGGMVTPALKKIFEKEGVPVVGLEAGAEYLVSELRGAAKDVEVCVMGGAAKPALQASFEKTLSVKEFPFLEAHVINGQAVLPAAMMIEWLGHAALHANPGFAFHGFDGFRVFKGVKLSKGQSLRITGCSQKASKAGGFFSARAELRGQDGALYAGAAILLANRLPKDSAKPLEIATRPYARSLGDDYGERLFHGLALRGLRKILGLSEDGIVAQADAAPLPRVWGASPLRDAWLADPLALDCAFQALILWSFERFGAGSLPSHVAGYRQFKARFPADGVRLAAKIVKSSASAAVADVEFLDASGEIVARMSGYECTIDQSLNAAFRRQAIEA